ncbi:MAG: Gldg family protein [Gemmatimonadales bacterium]|nr:Gldg family protein [Gemmatimonadales bacterium]
MRQLLAIVRRETGAFFLSAMGPVSLMGFLLAVGLFFTVFLLAYSDMSLAALQSPRSGNIMNLAEGLFRPLVSDMTLFLLLLMPAITMRLFAPEFRSGIYDMTASWPVADHIWVLGKWMSALGVALILILASSAYFAVVWFMGDPELGPTLVAMIGLVLLAACLAGWGVLSSVLFNHQMVAYFLAFAFSFSLFIVGSLEPYLPGPLGQFCRELSFLSHFERFSRGVLDSRDILFFTLMALVPLLAASAALAGRRLPARRRIFLWLSPLVGIALAIVIYSIGLYVPWSYDATENKRYSLAPQTLQVLDILPDELASWWDRDDSAATTAAKLPKDELPEAELPDFAAPDHVQIYAFYQRLDPARDDIEVLLKACSQRTGALRFKVVDPETELELVRQYGITVSRTLVVEVGDFFITVLQPQESALINAVYRMATNTRPLICHLLGHGEHLLDSNERPGYSTYYENLNEQGYDVRSLYLPDLSGVPPECAVVVVAGPRTDPSSEELLALEKHLGRGGSILGLFDPPTPSGWVEWMASYRVDLTGNVLVAVDNGGEQFGVGARTVVVTDGYGDHEIARTLQGMATVFPLAQPLAQIGDQDPQIKGAILLKSHDLSWGEVDPDTRFSGQARFDQGVDIPGPLPLGMVVEKELESGHIGRLAVFGNSEFLNNANHNLGGNRDLLLNTMGWLAREETLIEVRARDPLNQPVILSPTEKNVYGWGSVLGWPILVGSLALGFMLRGRREGNAL